MGFGLQLFQSIIGVLIFIIVYGVLLLLFTKGYYVQNTSFKKCFTVSSIVGIIYFVLILLGNLINSSNLFFIFSILLGVIVFVSMILLTKKQFSVSVMKGIGVSLLSVILLYIIGYLIGILFGMVR